MGEPRHGERGVGYEVAAEELATQTPEFASYQTRNRPGSVQAGSWGRDEPGARAHPVAERFFGGDAAGRAVHEQTGGGEAEVFSGDEGQVRRAAKEKEVRFIIKF